MRVEDSKTRSKKIIYQFKHYLGDKDAEAVINATIAKLRDNKETCLDEQTLNILSNFSAFVDAVENTYEKYEERDRITNRNIEANSMDVTRVLQKEADKIQAISRNRNEFCTLITDLYGFVDDIRNTKTDPVEGADLMTIKRALHTFKGQAGMLNLFALAGLIDTVEDTIHSQYPQSIPKIEVDKIADQLERLVDDKKRYARNIFGDHFVSEGRTKIVDCDTLAEMRRLVAAINCDEPGKRDLNKFIYDRFLSVPIFDMFRGFKRELIRLCELKGKPVPDVIFEGDNIPVVPENYGDFFKAIIHMARNIGDHALETAEDRVRKGKPYEGTVTVNVRQDGDMIIFDISDDGQGINPAYVRDALRARGKNKEAQKSDDEVIYHILDSDFSTSVKTNMVSGRGIGMNVVYQALNDIGGNIEIKSNYAESKGTTFTFKIPYLSFEAGS